MLPINSQPMSPSMSSNMNSGNNMLQSGSELRYSPISPHYNNSPMRGYSPSSNRHYNGISPSYSYNSPSSPNYSPNSSGKRVFNDKVRRAYRVRTAAARCTRPTAPTEASSRSTTPKAPPIIWPPPTLSGGKMKSTVMKKMKKMINKCFVGS